MKKSALALIAFLLSLSCLLGQQARYSQLKTEAEKFYSEGSFTKAREVYQRAKGLPLSAEDARWVAFRLADTQWRSQAGTETADMTQYEAARPALEALVRDRQREDEHDRVWAEVEESLGDFFWTRRHNNNWGEAFPHYQKALDWWAGQSDLRLARQRYLQIVWKMARPSNYVEPYYYYGYWGNYIPQAVLENALKIAQTDEDKAHAHYLIAMTLRQQSGDWENRQRVPEEFEAAIKLGKKTEWYDDALYNYGEWMMNYGRAIQLKNGSWSQEADYKKALELFKRITTEFTQGETRFFEQAKQQIKNITDPQLNVSAGNIFLPDSEIQYYLSWRNVKHIDLALYPVTLTQDVKLSEYQQSWLHSINLNGREKLKSWSRETNDKGDYKPGSDTIRLDAKLPPGAYILEAKGGGVSGRDLILVTDTSIVLKTSGKQTLVYVCNALNGSPLPNAKVSLWERYHENNAWHAREMSKESNKDGITVFDLTRRANYYNTELFASAILKDRQAFSTGNSYYGYRQDEQTWRIYAFTDRPAYRPNETAQWKFIARRHNGSVYSTPANQTIEYRIDDPRGTMVKEGKATLNAFGSVWGSLDLLENMILGEYRVTFWDEGRAHSIGNAILFRLEEYKLPEFKVSVQTPEENGKKKTFLPGEKVEVNIQADYYFGGAVANANVEVVVYQNPFYHYWYRPHEFPWFYNDMSPVARYGRHYYGGNGQIIKRETIKTDADGKAKLTFDTPRGQNQDFEFKVEARVTDASRREIIGNGMVRVTRQRYYVYPTPDHCLYRPQDKVKVDFKALDANEQPVETEGIVKVTRDYWFEIWLDPNGKEIKGEELKRIRSRSMVFPPPPPKPDDRPWQLKFRGYEHDEILVRTLKTDTNGGAQLTFTPEREGYYRIAWTSEDTAKTNARPSAPIEAETTVWVATGSTTELGYRQGGVQIIADKDTFRVGQKAPIMLSVPTNDRYVLFSVEGEDLYSSQLVHVTGTVKLVELPIEEKHVPNIFLNAVMVSDRQIFNDTEQIVVPPTRNFLSVDIKPDRNQYQPREEGTLIITTRDHNNKPVPAEVSFGLVDESVYYIQSDYAGDPRQFYFGEKRRQEIQTQSSFNQKSYTRLVEGEQNQLIDERNRDQSKLRRAGNRLGEAENQLDDEYGYKLAKDSDSLASLGGAFDRKKDGYFARQEMALAKTLDAPAAATRSFSATAGEFKQQDKTATAKLPAQEPEPEPAVQVRSDFRSTILWKPDVTTDLDGTALLKVKYPDSLTGWKATARAVTAENQFGMATTNTRTKQPLIVRLQAPRFFLVGDVVTISAVVNNNTDTEMFVKISLDNEGLERTDLEKKDSPLRVPANSEARKDWFVEVKTPGTAKLKVTGRGEKYADAMQKSYPIYEHGMEKFISRSGKVRGNDVTVKLNIPKERKPESTTLSVQVTPSMAVTMLDALPYLIDYPYGCTEQTMSRFLPAAITAKTLKDLGLQPEDVMSRLFGGIEATNAAATHPKGKKDLQKLDEMVKQGLERLYDFQHADGGWGWWKQGESDHFMTAYVVWGLALARDAGIKIKTDVLSSGALYLDKHLVEEEEHPDMQAWMLHAMGAYYAPFNDQLTSKFPDKASDNLWNRRDSLNAYTRALFALSQHYLGNEERAKILIANLENGVKRDEKPDTSVIMQGAQQSSEAVIGTAHWGEDGIYWRWSDGDVEATAFALRALLAIDPQNKLIEPVTNWLIKNRRGAQWSNTRDTAITVLTMNDYLRVSGELSPEMEYELFMNDQSIAKKKISGADVFNAPSQFTVDAKLIRDGENKIRIVRKNGKSPIYFAANAQYFSLEEPITPAGNEIFVRRQYYKLVGRPTLLKGYVYDRQPLNNGETVKSGERVETVVTIEAKNNYEYLVFEDLKPAGLEAVEVRSGESLYANELKSGAVECKFGTNGPAQKPGSEPDYQQRTGKRRVLTANSSSIGSTVPTPAPSSADDRTGRTRWVHQELRDRKVALFIDKLPEGVWQIKYDLRAEVPGQFHALPVVGHAMYVPEIRCNGAEIRINVEDSK